MLSQKVLFLAEPIARAVANDPSLPGITAKLNPIVLELNQHTYPTIQVEEDSAIAAIVDQCDGQSAHHQEVQDISTKVACGIRNGMLQIQQYLKPFAVDLAGKLNAYSEGYVSDYLKSLTGALQLRFVELDSPLLQSPLYPTAISSPTFDPAEVSADAYTASVKMFQPMTDAVINGLVSTNNEELNALFADLSAADLYRDYICSVDEFGHNLTNQGKTYDFTRVLRMDLPSVFAAYLMLKRFQLNDDMVNHVAGVSLAEYRQHLDLMVLCFESLLVTAKRTYAIYATREIAVLSTSQVQMEQRDGAPYLKSDGPIVVAITRVGLDKLETADVSLMSALIGWFLAPRDRDLPSIASNAQYYSRIYEELLGKLREGNVNGARTFVLNQTRAAIQRFQTKNPELHSSAIAVSEDKVQQPLLSLLDPAVNTFVDDFINFVVGRGLDPNQFVMNSGLIVNLGEVCGLRVAARILALATISGNDTVDDQSRRERLGKAVTQAIVEFYTGALK